MLFYPVFPPKIASPQTWSRLTYISVAITNFKNMLQHVDIQIKN